MRKLFLLRHGKSSWDDPGVDDFERPLNGRGRKAAKRMAAHLAETGIRPALVLVSAAVRTQQTWEIIAPVLAGVPVAIEDGLYGAGKSELMARLRKLHDHLASAMLVGHNPGLERLALSLCQGHGEAKALERMEGKYPTGALAILETDVTHWAQLAANTCHLAGFVRPKDLGAGDGEE